MPERGTAPDRPEINGTSGNAPGRVRKGAAWKRSM